MVSPLFVEGKTSFLLISKCSDQACSNMNKSGGCQWFKNANHQERSTLSKPLTSLIDKQVIDIEDIRDFEEKNQGKNSFVCSVIPS